MQNSPKKTIKLRRNSKLSNRSVISQQLGPLQGNSQAAELWLEAILLKTEELNELYALTTNFLDQLSEQKKNHLKRVFNRLSVKNLDSLIKINISQLKNR